MKIAKSDLDQLTKDAAKVAMMAAATLAATDCPYVEWYELLEEFAAKVDKTRAALELESVLPPEMAKGVLSATVRLRLTQQEKAERVTGKRSIGFQAPEKKEYVN